MHEKSRFICGYIYQEVGESCRHIKDLIQQSAMFEDIKTLNFAIRQHRLELEKDCERSSCINQWEEAKKRLANFSKIKKLKIYAEYY